MPGVSGNPGGRPPGRSVSARLRDLLEKGEIGGKPLKDGKQVADLLTEVILREALNGDYRFVEMVLNRTEGKVVENPAEPESSAVTPAAAARALKALNEPDGDPQQPAGDA